jgi:transcriptional regulator with XRE-family HTH domain
MAVNIIAEFEAARERTGWTYSLLAQAIHISKSSITHWIHRDNKIPDDKLKLVADILDDYEFRTVCAEYTYGVRVHSEAHVQDTPQARYFSQAKEEDDRKRLDGEFTILLGKPKHERTEDDRRRVLAYLKELDEEIEEKGNYKAAIMTDWGLTLKEVS